MYQIKSAKDKTRLRRTAMQAQGLLSKQPFGSGLAGVHQAISQLGYLQIDTISVIERAHHHTLFSRLPSYQPNHLNRLLAQGKIFEYWSHAAAFLPIEDYRFSLPYKHALRSGQRHWFKQPDQAFMTRVLATIEQHGPMRSRDFDGDGTQRGGWWDWKPAKKAIEQLYMEGRLMVVSREGFEKTYDLTERTLPSGIDTSMPSVEACAAYLLQKQLSAQGIANTKSLAYHFRHTPELKKAIHAQVAAQCNSGKLVALALADGSEWVACAETFEGKLPRATGRVQILSPFDNLVIQRERLSALFDFGYQLECYVPQAKRRFGYFSLPILYRDNFVGRMDCKAHRKDKLLEIKQLHIEAAELDETTFLAAFEQALAQFIQFQGCQQVQLSHCQPNHWRQLFTPMINNINDGLH